MQRGFTLIELAIVLVIIGLIVGGVLVGQDLIKAAQIRAVTTDIDRYNTAANAFQTKYGGLPGDLLSTKAKNNGLCYSSGAAGMGDGNGVLEDAGTFTAGGGNWEDGMGGEDLFFWLHLSQAQMIPFGPVGISGANGYPGSANATWCSGTSMTTMDTTTAPTNAVLQAILPKLRIRDSAFLFVGGAVGLNYFSIGNYGLYGGDGGGTLVPGPVLTPREALGIDQKLDDGYPDRGIVWSGSTTPTSSNSYLYYNIAYCGAHYDGSSQECGDSAMGGTCYDDTTVGQGKYMTSTNAKANAIACTLVIRASF